jgi:hypothetical protein
MTNQQRQIARYLAQDPLLGRYTRRYRAMQPIWAYGAQQPLPRVEDLAEGFLSDAEFRVLALGSALGTTEGQLIAEAVSMVIPPEDRPLFDLAVDALTLAALRQHEESRRRAGAVALAVAAGVVLLFVAAQGG